MASALAATVQPLSFPRVASTSAAYAWAFTIAGIQIGVDLVLFTAGTYAGYLTYADLGPPAVATAQAFVHAAVAKAEKGSTAPVTGAVSIASAPVQTAHTKLGTIAYRIIGRGPPMVLITGWRNHAGVGHALRQRPGPALRTGSTRSPTATPSPA